ncbi:hypothetical protein F5H01DRAFT_369456 [Linnemannia elongata]|nr:hypothetical protein F5H01DRAFT_369456 [Linnemannia elongata]
MVTSNDDSSAWPYFHIHVFYINCLTYRYPRKTLYEVEDCKDDRAAVATKKCGRFKKNKNHVKCNDHCICNTPSDCEHLIPATASQTTGHTSDWACDARLSSSGTLSTTIFPRPESLD